MSLGYYKKEKRIRIRLSIAGRFIVVVLSILFLTGSAGAEMLAKKSDSRKSLTGSDRKKKKKDDESVTNFELLPLVTAFADNYAARVTQSNLMLQKRLKNNTDRLAAFNMMIQGIQAAYNISVEPNSVIAILDMTVMVTLQRMAWEEHWYPKRFGGPAQDHLKTLRLLEKKIWEIAGQFLTAEQQRDLRNIISKWRKTNPNQQIVYSVRFTDFRDEIKTGLKDPKGLFSGVKKATNAAEELLMLGERYRFLLTRMQMMLNSQLQLAFLQMVSQPDVNRLLKDANRVTASVESIAASASGLPETAKTIIKEAGAETEQFRNLTGDLQQMLTVGKEVIISANETLDSIDTLVSRFDPIREKKQGTEPIDIAAYRGAAKDFTETAREANLLIQSLDRMLIGLTGQLEADRQPGLYEAVKTLGQESRAMIDYIFYRAIIFCLLVILGITIALLVYRYVSVRLSDARRST
ncbi:MAG: hypothetical protein PVF37_16750 [Desulfobacterales bacterium]|jgi:hypothetical protein